MENSKLIYRIFGLETCAECIKLKKSMDFYGFEYEFVDIDLEENDELCDKFNVSTVPHTQVVAEASGEVVHQHIGFISPIALFKDLADKLAYEDPNITINGVAPLYGDTVKKRGCGCGEPEDSESDPEPSAGNSSKS